MERRIMNEHQVNVGTKAKILIVDDEETVCAAMRELLDRKPDAGDWGEPNRK